MPARMLAAAAFVFLGMVPAISARAETLVCTRQSGGPMPTFSMTVDYDAKEIDVPAASGLEPLPDSVEITPASVQWGFMRGFAELNRKTGRLDWDASSEYAYLETIGQPSGRPESDFKGRMLCRPEPPH